MGPYPFLHTLKARGIYSGHHTRLQTPAIALFSGWERLCRWARRRFPSWGSYDSSLRLRPPSGRQRCVWRVCTLVVPPVAIERISTLSCLQSAGHHVRQGRRNVIACGARCCVSDLHTLPGYGDLLNHANIGVDIALMTCCAYCTSCSALQANWWLGNAQHHTPQLHVSSLAVWQNVSRRLRSIIMAGAIEHNVPGECSCSHAVSRCSEGLAPIKNVFSSA